jgi:hypothetical protein
LKLISKKTEGDAPPNGLFYASHKTFWMIGLQFPVFLYKESEFVDEFSDCIVTAKRVHKVVLVLFKRRRQRLPRVIFDTYRTTYGTPSSIKSRFEVINGGRK